MPAASRIVNKAIEVVFLLTSSPVRDNSIRQYREYDPGQEKKGGPERVTRHSIAPPVKRKASASFLSRLQRRGSMLALVAVEGAPSLLHLADDSSAASMAIFTVAAVDRELVAKPARATFGV